MSIIQKRKHCQKHHKSFSYLSGNNSILFPSSVNLGPSFKTGLKIILKICFNPSFSKLSNRSHDLLLNKPVPPSKLVLFSKITSTWVKYHIHITNQLSFNVNLPEFRKSSIHQIWERQTDRQKQCNILSSAFDVKRTRKLNCALNVVFF